MTALVSCMHSGRAVSVPAREEESTPGTALSKAHLEELPLIPVFRAK
jgi:hypothetical protein